MTVSHQPPPDPAPPTATGQAEPRFTRGPWYWDARDSHVRLVTIGRGQVYVMGFARLGMQSAQPTFQAHRPECDGSCGGCGRMTKAISLSAPFDHNGVGFLDHPDAHLIITSPELYSALEQCCNELVRMQAGVRFGAEIRGREVLAAARGEAVVGDES